jgi:hypothetical protein
MGNPLAAGLCPRPEALSGKTNHHDIPKSCILIVFNGNHVAAELPDCESNNRDKVHIPWASMLGKSHLSQDQQRALAFAIKQLPMDAYLKLVIIMNYIQGSSDQS